MNHILITGGSGLIGRRLIPLLREKGHSVVVLTRGAGGERDGIRYFHWDVQRGELDPAALRGVETIIHLAGASIAAGRWTKKGKRQIIDSRVKSAELLLQAVRENGVKLRSFISSSAVGYYGAVTSDHIFTEDDPPADDFMGTVCRLWEEAAERFQTLGARVVKLRTGLVLAPRGGALAKLVRPVKWGLGSPLGGGRQFMPWVHIDDLVNIYLRAVEDGRMAGAFNAVAPEFVTNAEFMRALAQALGKPFFLPPVPAPLLKLLLGEMATTILEGSRVSAEKIQSAGFRFRYPVLREALRDLLGKVPNSPTSKH